MKYADRERRQRGRMSLVHVESPAQRDDLPTAQGSDDDGALVSGDGGLRKAGNLAEWNPHRVLD
jgi:hypothetical protein